MWTEPLTVRAEDAGAYAFDLTVVGADGRPLARVRCGVNVPAGCGVFGEIDLLDPTGTRRQRLRAFVLLVREALRHGDAIGVTRIAADTPPRLEALVARLSGLIATPSGGRRRFRGELHEVRSHALAASDAAGDIIGVSPAQLDELVGALEPAPGER